MSARRTPRILSFALTLAAISLSLAVRARAQETILYNFPGNWIGGLPQSSLLLDPSGNLYGVTLYGGADPKTCNVFGGPCGTVYELSPNGDGSWTYKGLHSFKGDADGGRPFGGLTRDAAGNLYGTTAAGGNVSQCVGSTYLGAGCGVVFKLSRSASGVWKETVLYTFTGGTDGGNPITPLIIDPAGNLYGTTLFGGSLESCAKMGCGVVFRISHNSTGWHETTLRAVDYATDGQYPRGLARDNAGNIYGVTSQGANNTTCNQGCGSVFRLSPTASGPWSESILYAFQGGTDGSNPEGGLIFDGAGNLYGTTELGGSSDAGTVFELSPTASGPWTETQLHVFTGPPDAESPASALVFDRSGKLFGASAFGGSTAECSTSGCGTIFELSPKAGGTWSESTIFAFDGSDGGDPNGIVTDGAGHYFGVAQDGSLGLGLVFEITE
jgi:uncharacterized repeat protein (TIGR03803 family)